jgi:hypothetical protein
LYLVVLLSKLSRPGTEQNTSVGLKMAVSCCCDGAVVVLLVEPVVSSSFGRTLMAGNEAVIIWNMIRHLFE